MKRDECRRREERKWEDEKMQIKKSGGARSGCLRWNGGTPNINRTKRTNENGQFLLLGVCTVKQQRNKIKQEEIDFSLFFRFFKLLHFYSFLFLAELAVVTNFATFLMLFFRLAFLFSCLFFVGFCCFAALAFS